MKTTNIITETLKDLNIDKVNALYDKLVSTYFEPKEKVDWNIMYIFPDGRMIGSKVRPRESGRGRGERIAYHTSIYKTHHYDADLVDMDYSIDHYGQREDVNRARVKADDSPENFEKQTVHPASNDILAKYYNLIIVVPFDEDGGILIPPGVEPTEAQATRIDELIQFGYKMLTKRNWRLSSGQYRKKW